MIMKSIQNDFYFEEFSNYYSGTSIIEPSIMRTFTNLKPTFPTPFKPVILAFMLSDLVFDW